MMQLSFAACLPGAGTWGPGACYCCWLGSQEDVLGLDIVQDQWGDLKDPLLHIQLVPLLLVLVVEIECEVVDTQCLWNTSIMACHRT